MNDTMVAYRRAQDGFDTVLTKVPADRWDAPSACAEWTIRDVAGHVVWAARQLRAWATGDEYTERAGAPGAPHPAVLAGQDPVAAWREARAAATAALTDEALTRVTSLPGLGEVPVAALVPLLITDLVAHAWDIGHPLGMAVRTEPELVTVAFDWARAHALRAPGFFGPELTPPADGDDQDRLLAFLGRAA